MADCNYVRSELGGARLFAYVTRRLGRGLTESVDGHAESCEPCFEYLRGAESMSRTFIADNGSPGRISLRRFRDPELGEGETVENIREAVRDYESRPQNRDGFFDGFLEFVKKVLIEIEKEL